MRWSKIKTTIFERKIPRRVYQACGPKVSGDRYSFKLGLFEILNLLTYVQLNFTNLLYCSIFQTILFFFFSKIKIKIKLHLSEKCMRILRRDVLDRVQYSFQQNYDILDAII